MKLKLEAIIKNSKDLIKFMKHEDEIKNVFGKNSLFSIVIENNETWKNFAFLINIILNFIICLSYTG
jgi:hypothetical protein